jgi:hypothetical protein
VNVKQLRDLLNVLPDDMEVVTECESDPSTFAFSHLTLDARVHRVGDKAYVQIVVDNGRNLYDEYGVSISE